VGNSSGSNADAPLAERWNGSSWVLQSAKMPSTADGAFLRAVSCVSTTMCMTVGSRFAGSSNTTLIETWGGAGWSNLTSP
jgi:hypothetical protein